MLKNIKLIHTFWIILVALLVIQDSRIEHHQRNMVVQERSIQHDAGTAQINARSEAPFNTTNSADMPSIKTTAQAEVKAPSSNFQKIIQGSKLHYIGVHESNASEYTEDEKRKRHKECSEQQTQQVARQQSAVEDCWDYAYRILKDPENQDVIVQINSQQPVSLILTSYESVKWVLKGNVEQVKMVYMSGYESSDLSLNVSASKTKIFGSFYESLNCSRCMPSPLKYFDEYEQSRIPSHSIEQWFGHPLTSAQGTYKGHKFYIN